MNFLEIEVHYCRNVYPPGDDSFMLAEVVHEEIGEKERVLDLGTGTGIIALTAAKKGASVTALDINEDALSCARQNARVNSLHLKLLHSDLFQKVGENFDVIVFNPPYLPREEEPRDWLTVSWDGGRDGREVVDRFLEESADYLTSGGRLYFVQSSLNSMEKSINTLKRRGYHPRVVVQKNFFFEKLYVIEARKP